VSCREEETPPIYGGIRHGGKRRRTNGAGTRRCGLGRGRSSTPPRRCVVGVAVPVGAATHADADAAADATGDGCKGPPLGSSLSRRSPPPAAANVDDSDGEGGTAGGEGEKRVLSWGEGGEGVGECSGGSGRREAAGRKSGTGGSHSHR